jgi:hypothetical protein
MNKIFYELWDTNAVKCTLIICFTLLLSVVIYCFSTRYQMVALAEHDRHSVYIYNRFTGKTWITLEGPPYYYIPIINVDDKMAREIMMPEKKK